MFSFEGTDVAGDAVAFLEHALQQAIPYSEAFTEGSLEALKQFYILAREDVKRQERRARLDLYEGRDIARNDISTARQLANSYFKEFYERGQALGAPFREAGYQALDMYQDTLGIPRSIAGSSAMAKAAKQKAITQGARQRLAAQGHSLINRLDVDDYDSRRNLGYMANAGLNPQGLLRAVRDVRPELMGLKDYEDRHPGLLGPLGETDFESPELSTAGLGEDFQFGDGIEESEIDTKSGEFTNKLNRFVNDIRQRAENIPGARYNYALSDYVRNASPVYQQLYAAQAKQTPQSRSISNLLNFGSYQNPVPYNVS